MKNKFVHYGLWCALGLILGFGAGVSVLWGLVIIVIVMAIDLNSFETGKRVTAERLMAYVDSMVMNALHQENFEIEPADLEAQEESE